MNLDSLRRMHADLLRLTEALGTELTKAERARDPLAVHIFQARHRYRQATEHDTSKDSHHTMREVDSSLRRARELGYRGGKGEWLTLLLSSTSNRL